MIFFLIFFFNLFFFINLNKISKLINIYDIPDSNLKLHKNKIPLLGGIIIFLNLIIFFSFQLIFLSDFLMIEKSFFSFREIIVLIFFILTFFLIGLYDDKYRVDPYKRIILVTIFSIIALSIEQDLIITKFSLSFFGNEIHLGEFSIFFSIFCIIILKNALNFYDGINGQSGIFYLIVFTFLYLKGDQSYFYLMLISILIFVLYLNLAKKIFFGDSGVYAISAVIIVSIIFEHNIQENIFYADEIFLLLILPGFDLVRLTVQRLISNKNIFSGDREHLHHLLMKKNSLLNTNIILLTLNIFPISALLVGLNFYFVFAMFIIVYFSLFVYLKKSKK